jgi:YesN/AraC family two-component response regulator
MLNRFSSGATDDLRGQPMIEKKTEILIVDDHQIVREGVRGLVNAQKPEWAISEAKDAQQAFEQIEKQNPDLIVMDITMPGVSGLEMVSKLRKSGFKRPF